MITKTAGTLAGLGLLTALFTGCATGNPEKGIMDTAATPADACVESEVDAQIFSAWNKGAEPPLLIDRKYFAAIKNHCNTVYGDLERYKTTTEININNFFSVTSPTLRGEMGRILMEKSSSAGPR